MFSQIGDESTFVESKSMTKYNQTGKGKINETVPKLPIEKLK